MMRGDCCLSEWLCFRLHYPHDSIRYRYPIFALCVRACIPSYRPRISLVPINTAAYAFIPKNKSNAASGLIHLARNIGGSIGISLVTTMLARRTQFHQANLNNEYRGSPQLQTMIC